MRALILAALVLLTPLPVAAQDDPSTAAPGRLTVVGIGSVDAKPDMARITMGVASRAATAAEAMSATSDTIARIFAELEAAGIAPEDLQTSNLSLSPVWQERPGREAQPEVSGYEATNTINVRVRDLDGLGGLIDAATQAGANTFHGLSFALQDPAPALDEARRLAVADAMAKAQLYAEAAGLGLGPVLAISEPGRGGPEPQFRAAVAEAMVIAPGELSTEASVTMEFALTAP